MITDALKNTPSKALLLFFLFSGCEGGNEIVYKNAKTSDIIQLDMSLNYRMPERTVDPAVQRKYWLDAIIIMLNTEENIIQVFADE